MLQCGFEPSDIQKACPGFFSQEVSAATPKKNRPHRLVSFPSKMYADPLHKKEYDQAVHKWVVSNAGV